MRYEHRQNPTALWYYTGVWRPPSGFPVLCNRVDVGVHVRFEDHFSVRGWWIV